MQIELPQELIERAKRLASTNEDTAAVISRSLDLMEFQEQEVAAVKEGVEAYKRGDHQSLEDFDREIREEFGFKTRD